MFAPRANAMAKLGERPVSITVLSRWYFFDVPEGPPCDLHACAVMKDGGPYGLCSHDQSVDNRVLCWTELTNLNLALLVGFSPTAFSFGGKCSMG